MYSLIIVEDEEFIRSGLVKHFPWREYGFEVAGDCSDGLKALDMISKIHPDVVMTDIRMPNMDGLELTETIRNKGIPSKVVILSVYNDFEYARKSLYLGASAYLLKPTRESEIRDVFLKIKKELDHSKNTLADDMKTHIEKAFFKGAVTGAIPRTEASASKSGLSDGDTSLEIKICSDLIDAVIRRNMENITPLVYKYMECLINTQPEPQFMYIKVDELVARLFFKLNDRGINIKDFCDDVTLYYKIAGNKTFFDLREWLKGFLLNVSEVSGQIATSRTDPVIRKATEYIISNKARRITLEELADIAYMSPAYFSRYFKQKTGKTVTEYIADVRLDMAKKLLAESEMKIYEVAEIVGYDDFRHFSKVFRLREGISPTDFKRKMSGSQDRT